MYNPLKIQVSSAFFLISPCLLNRMILIVARTVEVGPSFVFARERSSSAMVSDSEANGERIH